MAYRRSITARAKLFYSKHKSAPAFSYINHQNDDDPNKGKTPVLETPKVHGFSPNRSFTSHVNTFSASRCLYNDRRFALNPQQFICLTNCGSNSIRNISTGAAGEGAGVNAVEYLGDTANVLKDTASMAVETLSAQVDPLVNEVAIAAADSFFPIAALQYLIDYVHIFTGLNWWAAIVLTTLLIRSATCPLVIHQMKASSKFSLITPQIGKIQEEMQSRGMSPAAVADGQQRMNQLFKEYGVSPFTPLKGMFIQGPIFVCFFLAISNMVEKVPSFKEGGILWFTDLTVPDSMYILPVLTALTFWITVEFNMQEGMEGNSAAGKIKNISRGFAALSIPLTASFAQGIFCYWITANIFSFTFGMLMKRPAVKKALGIPIVPVTPPTPGGHSTPTLGFFEAIKRYSEAQAKAQKQQIIAEAQEAKAQKHQILSSSTSEESKPAIQPLPSTSSSLIKQKLKRLEGEVKARKKGGKKKK